MLDVEDFECSICRELAYKPVVNVCGHFFCFWCIHRAMSPRKESHCPLCRRTFGHFPRVCAVLHHIIQRAFPLEYQARDLEVKEAEASEKIFSPELPSDSLKPPAGSCGERLTPGGGLPDGQMGKHAAVAACGGESSTHSFSPSDFSCGKCQQLLHEPIVLNCGHVFCSTPCLSSTSKPLICPTCELWQPEGFPDVCKELRAVLMKLFPELYKTRDNQAAAELAALSAATSAGCTTNDDPGSSGSAGKPTAEGQEAAGSSEEAQRSPSARVSDEVAAATCTNQGRTAVQQRLKHILRVLQQERDPEERARLQLALGDALVENAVHEGFGCDLCGCYPIVGRRFSCTMCPKVGYDLCGHCYTLPSSSSSSGRFNQRHTPDHKMLEKMSQNWDAIVQAATLESAIDLLGHHGATATNLSNDDDDDDDDEVFEFDLPGDGFDESSIEWGELPAEAVGGTRTAEREVVIVSGVGDVALPASRQWSLPFTRPHVTSPEWRYRGQGGLLDGSNSAPSDRGDETTLHVAPHSPRRE